MSRRLVPLVLLVPALACTPPREHALLTVKGYIQTNLEDLYGTEDDDKIFYSVLGNIVLTY